MALIVVVVFCSGSRCPCGEYCNNKNFQRVSALQCGVSILIIYLLIYIYLHLILVDIFAE